MQNLISRIYCCSHCGQSFFINWFYQENPEENVARLWIPYESLFRNTLHCVVGGSVRCKKCWNRIGHCCWRYNTFTCIFRKFQTLHLKRYQHYIKINLCILCLCSKQARVSLKLIQKFILFHMNVHILSVLMKFSSQSQLKRFSQQLFLNDSTHNIQAILTSIKPNW